MALGLPSTMPGGASTIRELEGLRPTFVSVTYGAGGSTRERTVRMKSSITEQTTLTPVGHLTCVGPSVADLGTNVRQISRFAQLSGARLPEPVVRRLEAVGKAAAAVRAVGVEIAVELCQRLLAAGAPGLHFSTLNHSTATRKAFAALGLGALR